MMSKDHEVLSKRFKWTIAWLCIALALFVTVLYVLFHVYGY